MVEKPTPAQIAAEKSSLAENFELYRSAFLDVKQTVLANNQHEGITTNGIPYKILHNDKKNDARVVRFEMEGKALIAKYLVPESKEDLHDSFEDEIDAHIIKKDDPHFVSLLAYSPLEETMIMEEAKGESIESLFEKNQFQLTNDFIAFLIQEVIQAYNQGVVLDPDTSNIFWDGNQYTFIDYHLIDEDSLSEEISYITEIIRDLTTWRRGTTEDTQNKKVRERLMEVLDTMEDIDEGVKEEVREN